MKTEYPIYKQGELNELEKKLSPKNKTILADFLKKCSITAGKSKVNKIRNILLQIYDVTEINLYKQTKESIDSFLIVLNKSNRSVWTKNEVKVYLKQFVKWYYKDLEMIENVKADNKRGLDPKR